jgi:hypothetical protein
VSTLADQRGAFDEACAITHAGLHCSSVVALGSFEG